MWISQQRFGIEGTLKLWGLHGQEKKHHHFALRYHTKPFWYHGKPCWTISIFLTNTLFCYLFFKKVQKHSLRGCFLFALCLFMTTLLHEGKSKIPGRRLLSLVCRNGTVLAILTKIETAVSSSKHQVYSNWEYIYHLYVLLIHNLPSVFTEHQE